MATAGKYRHQDVSTVPRGYHVRTVRAGKHQVRIAFPKGARKTGAGQIVSILHPKAEQNPAGCGAVLNLVSGEIASLAIPVDSLGNGFGGAFEDALDATQFDAADQNPFDWRGKWEAFKAKLSSAFEPHHKGTEAESNPVKKNYTEQVTTSDGKTVFINVDAVSGGRWRAEGYPVVGKKIKRVQHPKVAFGASEADAYDALVTKLEPNPAARNGLKYKRNLDEIDQASKLVEEWQGAPAEEVREIQISAKTRDDYAHLGWTVQQVYQPAFETVALDMKKVADDYWPDYKKSGDSVKSWRHVAQKHGTSFIILDVTGDEIELCASADRKQLFFLGGKQGDIVSRFGEFEADAKHDLVDLGNMVALGYEAQKSQAGDTEPRPYSHIFGEEGGTPPRASWDSLNKRVLLSGGTYHLEEADRGIIN
jgi:hypothetical protein